MVFQKGKAAGILSNERLKYETYCSFFTNSASLSLICKIREKHSSAKTQGEKEEALSELFAAMTIFSALVFAIYPNDERFRRMVQGSPELSGNFAKVSEWVGTMGGRELSEAFATGVEGMEGLCAMARGD